MSGIEFISLLKFLRLPFPSYTYTLRCSNVTNDSINLIKDLSENSDKRKTKSESEQEQCMLSKELSSQLPLDKLYNKDKDAYEDIEIENNAPQEEDNSNSQYNSEEFGLYKKYLD